VVFFCSSRQMPGWYIKLCCENILPYPIQFIIQSSSCHWTLCILSYGQCY
jgi:hypothetical protein